MATTMIDYSTVSLMASIDFNEQRDVAIIRDCVEKKNGRGESHFVLMMGRLTTQQRLDLMHSYNVKFSTDLRKELEKFVKSEVSALLRLALMPLHERELDNLSYGLAKDKEYKIRVLIDTILAKTNRDLSQFTAFFRERNGGKSLAELVESNVPVGFLRDVLLARLTSSRDEPTPRQLLSKSHEGLIDEDLLESDIMLMESTILKNLAANSKILIKLITSRSAMHMNKLVKQLTMKHKKSFYEILKTVITKDDKKALGDQLEEELLLAFKCLATRAQYFAERLNYTTKGLGTKDEQLRRLVMSHVEIDMGDIKREYAKLYKKTLVSDIIDDTSGDYKHFFCYVIGA